VVLVRRPPRTAAAAATIAGLGLLVAVLLLPATRFGYLLYPLVLLLWVPALRVDQLGDGLAVESGELASARRGS
jgi:hypothetical protein